MHPSTHLRAEVDALRAELAELKARLAPVTGPTLPAPDPRIPDGAPAGAFIDPCGQLRNGRGDLIRPPETPEEANARIRAGWKASDDAAAALVAASRAGCPPGTYRDWGNMLRQIDTGKLVSIAERELLEREAIGRQQAVDHRAWKVGQHLPVHPLPDDED